jgi:hypothetical protein
MAVVRVRRTLLNRPRFVYTPGVAEQAPDRAVKVRAYSPGKRPILIVELDDGDLLATYHETGYDLERAKLVQENWLYENAIGRHGFVEARPPREMPASSLKDYVLRNLL